MAHLEAHLDWILVAIGMAVALTGSWIQLQPERIFSRREQPWSLEPDALTQLRRLGACFLFMGVFFALQMTIDLTGLPWWSGTLAGLFFSIAAVTLVQALVRRRPATPQELQQRSLAEKVIEVR